MRWFCSLSKKLSEDPMPVAPVSAVAEAVVSEIGASEVVASEAVVPEVVASEAVVPVSVSLSRTVCCVDPAKTCVGPLSCLPRHKPLVLRSTPPVDSDKEIPVVTVSVPDATPGPVPPTEASVQAPQ